MADRVPLPGKFVWFELVAADSKKAQEFFRHVLGWNVIGFPADAPAYDMICTGDTPDTMIGGYDTRAAGRSHWRSYLSVEDVDAAARAAVANGGTIVEGPEDIPTVGRFARAIDPQGAGFCLFKSLNADPPDRTTAPHGTWVWNELHVPDAPKALAFYERVAGFTHRGLDMGPAGTYYVVSKNGVDRGGVSDHLPPGAQPHWLPYVAVDDADAVAARAWDSGGKVLMGPETVPGAGRLGVIADPTGAMLGILKPEPLR